MDYEINDETLAVLPISDNKCRVVENSNEYYIDTNSFDVIEHSCEYFGSTFLGRHVGSIKMLGSRYKTPIIIAETDSIIVFPTHSPRNKECIWICLNNINKIYKTNNDKTVIEFVSGDILELNISYNVVNNQILKATRLKHIIDERKNTLNNTNKVL